MLPSGGTSTFLIPRTNGNVVLGSSQLLPFVDAITVRAPEQLVVVSAAQLLVATLP